MNIAITDACIFIDIYELDLTNIFFSLNMNVHTSVDVFNELYLTQQYSLQLFIKEGRLMLHSLDANDRLIIQAEGYPRSLSENDKTVLHLAGKLGAMVLSSDASVRKYAKKKAVEYHGMLWIFDKLVSADLITKNVAAEKLQKLVSTNIIYQNNAELVKEMAKRIDNWKI